MNRYHDINFIMDSDIDEGIEIIQTAYKRKAEDMLWQEWLMEHIFMKEPTSFDEYKSKVMSSISIKKITKSKSEILKEAEMIKNADQMERKKVDDK